MAKVSSEEGRLRSNRLQEHIHLQARTISRAFRASGVAQWVEVGKNFSFV